MADQRTIAIIDPNRESRADLSKMLQYAGFTTVAEAGFGVEAVTAVQENAPDCILLSLEEPVTRGLQTSTALLEVLPEVPLIIYSSLTDGNSVRRAMLAGARDYLAVPLNAEAVIASLQAILDQEDVRQRRAAGEQPQFVAGGTVITIFGAKGGIGKTTIAANLATAMVQETGESVALVDLDTRFGDVAVLLDVPSDRTVVDVARDIERLDRVTIREYLVPHHSGLFVLPAPRDPADWEAINSDDIEKIVRLLSQTFDFVVLDTPGTFSEVSGVSLELATVVLLVTSMDVTSIKDTAMVLNMLRSWSFPEEKVKLLINHSNTANSITDDDIARTLDYEIFWHLPFDIAASRASQLGQPVVLVSPRSRVSQNLRDLARTICGVPQGRRKGGGPLGAFGKIFGRQNS